METFGYCGQIWMKPNKWNVWRLAEVFQEVFLEWVQIGSTIVEAIEEKFVCNQDQETRSELGWGIERARIWTKN